MTGFASFASSLRPAHNGTTRLSTRQHCGRSATGSPRTHRTGTICNAMITGLALAASVIMGPAYAAETEFDRYIVHHNVINTTFLSPEVARAYDIRRSSNRALVNVTVMEKSENGLRAVPATVNARATNRNQQMKFIGFRSVQDGDAVYQLGEVPVRGGEELDFEIDVRPQASNETLAVRFTQRFYGD